MWRQILSWCTICAVCTHCDYPTRIGTVTLQLSHCDCQIANVTLKQSRDVASHCTSWLSLNALHIVMIASISSHAFSSICTSLSSNLHHRIAWPPGPPYNLNVITSHYHGCAVMLTKMTTKWVISCGLSHAETTNRAFTHQRISQRHW